jgi:regulator of sigma E protease
MATNFFSNTLAFVLVLGFLIFAHEAGHFFVAKLFRVRVLVFSFGFGKRLFGFRRGDTDYRVSLIPLGGYVRMAGDTPEENETGDPNEFLSRPKWQRFLILVAGPAMNLLIAILFVAGMNMVGQETMTIRPIIGSVVAGKPAQRAGLQPGDVINRIDGEVISGWDDLKFAITTRAGTPVNIDFTRNGKPMQAMLTPEKEMTDYGIAGRAGIGPYIDTTLGKPRPGSPAEKAGLKAGDKIIGINGQPLAQLTDLDAVLEKAKNAPLPLIVQRGSSRIGLLLPAGNPKDLGRGIMPPYEVRKLSLLPALRESVSQNWKMLRYAATTMARMFRAEGSMKELSGPLSIARISGEMLRRGWFEVIGLMAAISLQLGVVNLLPIPVLDGGHVFILLVEGVVRRDLSLRVKERIQTLGFAVLAAIMLVVLYNDVIMNVMLLRKG